jgi:two-component system OmpR family response regulator
LAKLLLVDDDSELTESLVDYLKLENHSVELSSTGEDALQLLENFKFDAIILDWGLPGIQGVDVLRKFRTAGGKTPVIFLTGRNDIFSKEAGFDTGADDYLTKPFDVRELGARIRSLLRRPAGILPSKITVGNLLIEPDTRKVFVGGKATHLTNREYAVLEFLVRHPNQVYGARALLQAVWPSDAEASEDTVRSCMKNLRRKITVDDECIVKTIQGAGYTVEYTPEPQL